MDNIAVKLFPSALSDVDKEKEPMKVFLRIRPFIKAELSQNESQGCISIKDDTSIELCPPQNSFMFKSGMRLASDQSHEYSFTHVFREGTKQKEFFDKTMLPFVEDLLDGQNGLVFTYGVTNSGKTYTIQGVPEDGGILPRSLDVIFNSIKKQKYIRGNIKPKFCNEVTYLTEEEELQEDLIKKSVLNAIEHNESSKFMNSTSRSAACSSLMSDVSIIQKSDSSIDILSVIDEEIRQRISDNTIVNLEKHGNNIQYSIWISFMEIYNELMYDLFDPSSIVKGKKRTALKLGDDKNGNPYVKDLREVCVNSSDEAYKLLRLGQQNRRMAATKLNQSSSRSHSIFSIKLLKIVDEHVTRMSRISIVDLAGSERYCKTQAASDRLKEASNINSSIMTLGQCISALRYNQIHPKCQTIIPFRESKLTRLFQSFFLGKGKAAMIVNISQCASVFDETSNVMKFSAVAKQVKLKAQRATEIWKVPPITKTPVAIKSYPKICIITPATSNKRTLNDPTAFSYDELVNIVAELRDKLKKERKEKGEMESKLRAEICGEMNEVMDGMENDYKNQLQEQRERLEDLMEKRLDLLTNLAETLHKNEQREKHDSDGYVSAVLYQAEVLKLKDRDDTICELKAKIDELKSDKNYIKQLSPLPLSGLYECLKRDFEEAKETLAVQSEAMNRMQEQLMYKDDEIEKLIEALNDNSQDSIEVSKLEEVQNLLAETTRELEVTKGQLQEQDQKLRKLEQLEEDHKELLKVASNHEEWYELIKQKNVFLEEEKNEIQRKYAELNAKCESISKDLEDTAKNSQESVEAFQTVQFENEENCLRIEKLESVIKEHQDTLKVKESIIIEDQEALEVKDSLINELNNQVYELKKLESVISEHQETFKVKDSIIIEHQETLKVKDSIIIEYQEALKVKDSLINELNNQVYELKKLESIINEHQETLKVKDSFNSKLNNQVYELKKLESVINEHQEILNVKESIIIEHQEALKVKDSLINELNNQVYELKKLESVISELQETLKVKDSFNNELNDKVSEMKKNIYFYEQKESIENIKQQEMENLLTSKENLEIKIKDYEIKVEKLEKKLNCYENNISIKPEKDPVLHEGNMTPNKLVLKNMHSQKKFDNFSSPLSPMVKVKHAEIIQNLEKRLAETTKALEKKTANLVCKNNKIQQLEKECSKELLVEHDKIKKENADMHIKLDEFKKEYTNLLFSNEELKKKSSDFENSLTTLRQELTENKVKLDSALEELLVERNKYAKSVEYCQSTEAELRNVKEGLLIIQDKLKNHEMDSAESSEKSILLNEKLLNRESLLQSKEKEVLNLQEINEETKLLIQKLEFQKNILEENEIKLRRDLEDQRNSQTVLEDKFKIMFQELKESKLDLQNDLDIAWKEIDEIEIEKKQVSEQLSLSKSEIQHLKAELDRLINLEGTVSLDSKVHSEIVSTLTLQVQKLEEYKTKLIKKISKMEEDLLKQESTMSAFHSEINDLNIQLMEMSDKYSKASDELFVKNKILSQLEAETQSHLQKIVVLEENVLLLEKKNKLALEEEKISLLQGEKVSELNTEKISLLEVGKITINNEKLLEEKIPLLKDEKNTSKTKVSVKKRSKQKRISVADENAITPKKSKITPQKSYPSRKVMNCIQNNECETMAESICGNDKKNLDFPSMPNESLIACVSIALSPLQPDSDHENDCCSHINVGEFVALKSGSATEPIIGKVLTKSNNALMLEIWHENSKKSWSVKSGYNKHEVFIDEILCGGIYFTNSKKLPVSLQRKLQTLYS